MNTDELVARLAKNWDMDQAEAREMLDVVVQNISDNLAQGNDFTIPELGTFGTHTRDKQKSYNPHYEKYMMLPPKRVIDFSASENLEDGLKFLGIENES
jgi:nucleoid DNA-binding protein